MKQLTGLMIKYNSSTIFFLMVFMLISSFSCVNRNREMSVKIHNLSNLMPVDDQLRSDSIVYEAIGLGKNGLEKICSQVVSPGKGNDLGYRLIVESVSQYLANTGKEKNRLMWERVLIKNFEESINVDIKDYFLGQLNVIGSDYNDIFFKEYLNEMASSGSEVSGFMFGNQSQTGDR